MSYNYKILFIALVTTSTFLMAGCGKPLHANKSSNTAFSNNSSSNDSGEIRWDEKITASEGKVHTYDFKIPFGRVYKTAAKVVDLLAPRTCQNVNAITSEHYSKYQNNEIPCGQIVNNDWKQLISFDFEETATVKSGYTITVRQFEVPLWLSRQARSGVYTENDLDLKKEIPKVSSKEFAKDISVKWTPSDTGVNMGLCLNMPGGTLTAPERTVYANARKKTWYGHFSTTSGFEINPGSASWDYGRGCFAINLQTANLSENDAFTVVATQAPYMHNLQYSGLSIRITNWVLRLIDNILSIFNASIKKAVIKKVSTTINSIADTDIETGKWFTQVSADKMLESQGKKIHLEIMDAIQRTNIPMKSAQIKRFLKDKCRALKFSKSEKWTQKHEFFCSDLIDDLKVKILPFHKDEASAELGCYDSFANIHNTRDEQGQKKWWSDQCKMSVRFSVQITADIDGYVHELHDLILEHIEELQWPEKIQSLIEKYHLDSDALHLVLEELEKRGKEELEEELLELEIISIIAELKEKYSGLQR